MTPMTTFVCMAWLATLGSPLLAIGFWGLPLWAGAAAASAPVIIHLLNRLRFDRVRWAAMEFLLASRRRNRRRVQFEQLLLLALRVLIMLLLAAAFARIAWGPTQPTAATTDQGGPQTHVVLLDISMSMGTDLAQAGPTAGTSAGSSTPLAAAIRHVRALAGGLKPGDHFGLVLVHRTPELDRPIGPLAEGDLATLASRLEGLRPTDTEADFAAALEALYGTTGQTPTGWLTSADPKHAKVLHIVSDLRQTTWGGDRASGLAAALTQLRQRLALTVEVVDAAVASPDHPSNLAVVDFRPRDSDPAVMANMTVPAERDIQFLATVANFGLQTATARLSGFVRGRRQTTTDDFTVLAGQTTTVGLSLRFPPAADGRLVGGRKAPHFADAVVALVGRGGTSGPPDDALAADNRRALAVRVQDDGARVLLVTGDATPRDVENNIAVPILIALSPSALEGQTAPVPVTVTHLSEDMLLADAGDETLLRGGFLATYDLVVLANVGAVPGNLVPELGRFVRGGGVLAVFTGDRMQTAVWNEDLFRRDQRLLPAALEAPVDAVRVEGRAVTLRADSLDYSHPILADLRGFPEPLGPVGAAFNRYLRLRAANPQPDRAGVAANPSGADKPPTVAAEPDVRVLARFSDKTPWDDGQLGNPAILERRVGQGRVVLFASSSGPPWNDWSTDIQRRASFLVVAQGLVQAAMPPRVAALTAGEVYAAPVWPAANGSQRAVRAAAGDLNGLSLTRRDDPTQPAEGHPVPGFVAPVRDTAAQARFPETRHAGLYDLTAPGGRVIEMFAVNPVNGQGRLTRLTASDKQTLFGDAKLQMANPLTAPSEPASLAIEDSDDDDRTPRPAFTPFDQGVCQALLAAMMALMVIETVLSRVFSHYNRAPVAAGR